MRYRRGDVVWAAVGGFMLRHWYGVGGLYGWGFEALAVLVIAVSLIPSPPPTFLIRRKP